MVKNIIIPIFSATIYIDSIPEYNGGYSMESLHEYYHTCKKLYPFNDNIPDDEAQLRVIVEEMKCMEAEFKALRQEYERKLTSIIFERMQKNGEI